ncbi:MAG: DegT/DnrJ/EryC1/StrS family aminotransferase, partial [Smithellaceae bacterium]|nr:DegT/DnrJ/EryC1/StrS family aminotransferase [Smithellaceae bacterium]
IIRVKLKRIDQFNESRRLCAQLYREYIKRPDLGLPQELAGCTHVYHQFTLLSPDRDNLMKVLADHQCSSAIYYPIPLHLQEVFQTGAIGKEGLTISERCAAQVLSLPIFPELQRQEIEMISHAINHAA